MTSDSMSPTIFRGALVFSTQTPEKDLKPGDVVTVGIPSDRSDAVGRLIQTTEMTDGYYNLVFKGDNRTLPEDFPYTVKDASYVHQFSIPLLGFLVFFLSTPVGLVLLSLASLYFGWYYLFKMHDRIPWIERLKGLASYRKQVAEEQEEEKMRYGGIDRLKEIFDESENGSTELETEEEQR